MEICMRIGDETHHYAVPVVENVIRLPVGPIRTNYPPFLYDAVLVASAQATANRVSDDHVRAALQAGVNAVMEALEARAGNHISVVRGCLAETAGGPPTGGGARGGHRLRLGFCRPPRGDNGCRPRAPAREENAGELSI